MIRSTKGAGGSALRRVAGEAELIARPAFERMLADLSARFADVTAGGVLAEVERTLQRLVEFFGCDRCMYSEFAADGDLNVLCSVAVGIEPYRLGAFDSEQTWFVGELRAGRTVTGPRSHLSIPLRAHGRISGVLSVAGLHEASVWSADTVIRLTIIGDVFAAAMARARSEEEACALRARLWHADRVSRIDALTAAIAHDINQPLAAILSNAQAGLAKLRQGEARPEALREILEAVVRDDKRAAQTIRSMRTLLRQDDEGRARINLTAALREVLQLLAVELECQGIQIETRLEASCWVSADKAQIEQVALNLVLNAAAAMAQLPREARHLLVSLARCAGGRVAVEVRDSGLGIAPQDREAVFEPFWTTRKEGLGLGLAICRSIIEAHGGLIRAEANGERGATVRFELAAEVGTSWAQPVAPVPASAAAAPLPVPVLAGPVICIIDDDATVRQSLARLMVSQGYAVACHESAAAFLESAPAGGIGCILLDLHMPGMSGLELQARLAAQAGAPPVVFLTGGGDIAASVRAMKHGAVDFLSKPIDETQLFAAVETALLRHAGERMLTLQREAQSARLGRLSARERQVMQHVIRGRLNKQIAADLDIALQTVKQHRSRVMDKMQVESVAELVRACEVAGAA